MNDHNNQYPELLTQVANFLIAEADFIDQRNWQAWIDLFTEDSCFWMPAWRNEDEITNDPKRELSLIYLTERGVQDRVFRFDSGDAYSATPLATTCHLVSNFRLMEVNDQQLMVRAKAMVTSMDPRIGNVTRSCYYEYILIREAESFRIQQKKVVLLDRQIDGTIDVYNV